VKLEYYIDTCGSNIESRGHNLGEQRNYNDNIEAVATEMSENDRLTRRQKCPFCGTESRREMYGIVLRHMELPSLKRWNNAPWSYFHSSGRITLSPGGGWGNNSTKQSLFPEIIG